MRWRYKIKVVGLVEQQIQRTRLSKIAKEEAEELLLPRARGI